MRVLLINYFFIVAAFLLMLDSPILFLHIVSILTVLAVFQYWNHRKNANGFLTIIRTVCRTE